MPPAFMLEPTRAIVLADWKNGSGADTAGRAVRLCVGRAGRC